MNRFVNLHLHSDFSQLDGLGTLDDIVAKTKEYEMPGVALTDHGNMAGVYKFWKLCKENDIKPIIGCEFYLVDDHLDKTPKNKSRTHLTVLAKNVQGYKNLCKMSTISYTDGFYYKPRIDLGVLEQHKDGLIVLSGCSSSAISKAIRENNNKRAEELIAWFKNKFGEDFYLEKQFHGSPFAKKYWETQHVINEKLEKYSKELGIKCVISCDTHYINPEDTETHEMLLSIGTGTNYDDDNRMSLRDFDLSMQDPKEIIRYFPREAEVTMEVLEKCNFSFDQLFDFKHIILPRFGDAHEQEWEMLKKLVWDGCKVRYGVKTADDMKRVVFEDQSLLERVKYELDVIKEMGYVGYLLIVQDFVNWAKQQGILVGHGRGSAAASVVCYCLGITSVDPLVKGMVFERFLNKERYTQPDIDIDFQDNRRDEVIDYIKQKYGEKNICHIAVLSRLKAKSAVKDVARSLKLPFQESIELTKHILDNPNGKDKYLPASYEVPFIKQKMRQGNYQRIFDFAEKLEGKIRQFGQHACGVIISDKPLDEMIPLMVLNGQVTSQFEHKDLEEMQFLKYDFLGLSNLTVIDNTLRQIKKNTGKVIDFYNIPMHDENIFKAYADGRLESSFTMNTQGMQQTLRRIQCSSLNDLVATNALFRPGPMAFIDDYAKVKSGERELKTLCKEIEEETAWTYGVVAYQEQFLAIVRRMAGFSYGKADILRRAMAKKKQDLMDSMKVDFIEGCKDNGISENVANEFWRQTDSWVNYGFNFAHAYAYAVISYITGWLEYYYPGEYLSSCMQAKANDSDELSKLMSVAKCRGIKIKAPSVKRKMYFNSDGKTIFMGLSGIKGIGEKDIQGTWDTLEEFLVESNVNSGKLKALIEAGALDCYERRTTLYHNYDNMVEFVRRYKTTIKRAEYHAKKLSEKQVGLFGDETFAQKPDAVGQKLVLEPTPVNHITPYQLLLLEKARLGKFVSYNPLKLIQKEIKRQGIKTAYQNLAIIQNHHSFMSKSGSKIQKFNLLTGDGEFEMLHSGQRKFKDNDILCIENRLRKINKTMWLRDMKYEYITI